MSTCRRGLRRRVWTAVLFTAVASRVSASQCSVVGGTRSRWALGQVPGLVTRGGASKGEWVCDGDVCELRPPKKDGGDKAESKKQASRRGPLASKRGLDTSEQEDEDTDGDGADEDGDNGAVGESVSFLKALQNLFRPGGKGDISTVFSALVRQGTALVQNLIGGGSKGAKAATTTSKGSNSAGTGTLKAKKSKSGSAGAAKSKVASKTAAVSRRSANSRSRRGRGGGSRNSAAIRIQRELRDFQQNKPPNLSVNVREDNLNVWVITLTGVEGTLFADEKYKLRIEFPKDYPAKPPSVYFLKPTPRHQHVYTNGDICLDLLGKGWKPQITIRTLAISILSMLSSAREKGIPPDNSNHADNAPGKPQDGWLYHDDHC